MTLTEFKYMVAVARMRHFGHAAEACFVSQPTLSVAIKKLEDELGVQIFERGNTEVSVTVLGEQIVAQALRVLEQAQAIREIAKQGNDPLVGPVRLGIIYTISPYLLPSLVPRMIEMAPRMPLLLQENFTARLLELLKQGEIDCAIMAEPFPDSGLNVMPLYQEPFVIAVPQGHPWETRSAVCVSELKQQTMLLLGSGHCFRDQVLSVCPELSRFSQAPEGIQKTFEGSSLETIRHMVASGIGITVLPRTSVADMQDQSQMLRFVPFEPPVPDRQVVLVWRKSFTREKAMELIAGAVRASGLQGVTMLSADAPRQSAS